METEGTDRGVGTERLQRAEKEIRRWRRGAVALLIGAGASLLLGQAATQSRTVEAERFVLLGRNDKKLAVLEVTENGAPQLRFYDGLGRVIWSAPPLSSVVPAAPGN